MARHPETPSEKAFKMFVEAYGRAWAAEDKARVRQDDNPSPEEEKPAEPSAHSTASSVMSDEFG